MVCTLGEFEVSVCFGMAGIIFPVLSELFFFELAK
jgi:hypothetical protein